MQTSAKSLIRPTILVLALVYCVGIALVLTKGRILSGSVDISYHLQVLEAVRGRWLVPEAARAYLAEMYFYPKLSHRLAGWAADAGLHPLWALAFVATLSAAVGWLSLLDLARRTSALVLISGAALALGAAGWTGAVLGGEVVNNFFYPQIVAEAVCLGGVWVGAALVWRSARAFALFAPAATLLCGWLHLVGTLKLAGALAILAALRLGWTLIRERRLDRWSAAAVAATSAALFLNPSFAVMRRLSVNNGSVNFDVDLSLAELGLLSATLLAFCAAGLLVILLRAGRPAEASAPSAPQQAAAAILAFGAAAALAALAQWLALTAFAEGSVYAVRKHGFGVVTGLCFALPALAWLLLGPGRPRNGVARRAGWPVLVVAHLGLVAVMFNRPTQLDVPRVATLLSDLDRVRPRSQMGGVSYLFVTSRQPPVVSYMGTIAKLRSERDSNALSLLFNGVPAAAGGVPNIVTEVGDPTYDEPRCRRGAPLGSVVVVDGACIDSAPIPFKQGGAGAAFLIEGWSAPEAGGAWSAQPRAVLRVPLGPEVKGLAEPRLQISTFGFVPEESPRRTVEVAIKDGPTETFTFDRARGLTHVFVMPLPTSALEQGAAIVTFTVADPASPQALGLGPDPRQLGVGVEWVRILPKARSAPRP